MSVRASWRAGRTPPSGERSPCWGTPSSSLSPEAAVRKPSFPCFFSPQELSDIEQTINCQIAMSASSPRVILLMRMARGRNGCKHSLKLTHQQPQPTPDPGGIPTHARCSFGYQSITKLAGSYNGWRPSEFYAMRSRPYGEGVAMRADVRVENGRSSPPERILMKILTRNHFILRTFARTYTSPATKAKHAAECISALACW